MKTPTDGDLVRLKRVGRYLLNKKHYKLNLTADRSKAGVIDCFVDSDWPLTKSAAKARAVACFALKAL